jgi:transcriptional regulator with XRE-family HTH domain
MNLTGRAGQAARLCQLERLVKLSYSQAPPHLLTNEAAMIIGERLRALREEKHLSQGHIEKRTGLLRCYISRVENGHTVPSIETLEKMSRALEVPLYQLFYEGDGAPVPPPKTNGKSSPRGASGKEVRLFERFRGLLSRTNESDRRLLLHMARKMAHHEQKSA